MAKTTTANPPEEQTEQEQPPPVATVEEGTIRKAVLGVLDELGITPGDKDQGANPPEKPAGRTQAAVEADVESKVRTAIDKLRGEEDRDRRLQELEAKQTQEPERAPAKTRVSTRLMGWGRRG